MFWKSDKLGFLLIIRHLSEKRNSRKGVQKPTNHRFSKKTVEMVNFRKKVLNLRLHIVYDIHKV